MDITPLVKEGQQVIQGYSVNGFRVSGHLHQTAVVVTPDETFLWPTDKKATDVTIDDFAGVFSDIFSVIDVLIFGCGNQMVRPSPALQQAMKDKGVTLEAMDSAAACRTYNVLMAEGRRVAAALLPV